MAGDIKDKRFRRLLGREYMESEGLVPSLRITLNAMRPNTPLTQIASI